MRMHKLSLTGLLLSILSFPLYAADYLKLSIMDIRSGTSQEMVVPSTGSEGNLSMKDTGDRYTFVILPHPTGAIVSVSKNNTSVEEVVLSAIGTPVLVKDFSLSLARISEEGFQKLKDDKAAEINKRAAELKAAGKPMIDSPKQCGNSLTSGNNSLAGPSSVSADPPGNPGCCVFCGPLGACVIQGCVILNCGTCCY